MAARYPNENRRVSLTLDEAAAKALLRVKQERDEAESIKISALAWLGEVARLANTASHADAEIADIADRAEKTIRTYGTSNPITYNCLSQLLMVSIQEAKKRDECEVFSDGWREHALSKRMADKAWCMLWRQWTEYGD